MLIFYNYILKDLKDFFLLLFIIIIFIVFLKLFLDELSTKQIFTSELIDGIPVDKCAEMDEETRKHICRLIMELCLKELFVFRYMQTDPNWSNFFYNTETKQVR